MQPSKRYLIQRGGHGPRNEEDAASQLARARSIPARYASVKELQRGRVTPERDEIPFGDIAFSRAVMKVHGIDPPAPLDYPTSLRAFLHRDIRSSTLGRARALAQEGHLPFFVKPARQAKRFHGLLVHSEADLWPAASCSHTTPVWISTPLEMTGEVRVYVHGSATVGVHAAFPGHAEEPDSAAIQEMIRVYSQSNEAPIAYALDVALSNDGQTCLVEANDMLGLGNYGLAAELYADMVEARWLQLRGS